MARSTFAPTGDAAADGLLAKEPLALVLGMMLDQQIPIERAFAAPAELRNRIGHYDAARIAAMDPARLVSAFSAKPALHRYPRTMAERFVELCGILVADRRGDARRLWHPTPDAATLVTRIAALPGFSDHKARIFVALLAKRFGIETPGWRPATTPFGEPGYLSAADVDSPAALAKVREHKRAVKAAEQP